MRNFRRIRTRRMELIPREKKFALDWNCKWEWGSWEERDSSKKFNHWCVDQLMWAVVDASLLIANDKLRSWYTIHEKRYTLSKSGRDMDTFYLANLYNQWPTTVFAPTRWIYLQLGVANNHLKKKKKKLKMILMLVVIGIDVSNFVDDGRI